MKKEPNIGMQAKGNDNFYKESIYALSRRINDVEQLIMMQNGIETDHD